VKSVVLDGKLFRKLTIRLLKILFLLLLEQKRRNRSRYHLCCGLRWAQGTKYEVGAQISPGDGQLGGPPPACQTALITIFLTSDVELGFGEGAAGWALCFADELAGVAGHNSFDDESAVRQYRETAVVISHDQLGGTAIKTTPRRCVCWPICHQIVVVRRPS